LSLRCCGRSWRGSIQKTLLSNWIAENPGATLK
jgi:hypothetical protein